MSTLSVPVIELTNIRPHPDPEVHSLDLANALGWQIVVGRGLYKEGERVVYVPPDSVMPQELSDVLDITKYLSNGRVRQNRLRGEPSYGATVSRDVVLKFTGIDINEVPLETEMAEALGITKYEPPVRTNVGDAAPDNPYFPKFTEIESLRRYPNLIPEGTPVVVTEKIHGTNSRVGMVDGELIAGSRKHVRKNPEETAWGSNLYWWPLSIPNVRNLVETLGKDNLTVAIYGEIYGKVQKGYTYGIPGQLGYRAFALNVDGKYLDFPDFAMICERFNVEIVPVLGIIPYSFDAVRELVESQGKTTFNDEHPIEGGVVTPYKEIIDPRFGRVSLKYISDAYSLSKKKGSDYTDE